MTPRRALAKDCARAICVWARLAINPGTAGPRHAAKEVEWARRNSRVRKNQSPRDSLCLSHQPHASLEPSEPPPLQDPNPDLPSTDIIVLGRRITSALSANDLFGLRLHRAAEVYADCNGPARIIVSGGDVGRVGVTEAEAGAKYLRESLNIPAANVLMEEQAMDTVSNAVYSKLLLLKSGCRKPFIVSSCYHIPRVSFIFSHVLGREFEPTFISAATGLDDPDYLRHWRSETHKLIEAAKFIEDHDTVPGSHERLLESIRSNGPVVEDTVE